jgi:hypothetical protein
MGQVIGGKVRSSDDWPPAVGVYAWRMSDEHRADAEKFREVAEDLRTPGQDATPDGRDGDDRDPLRREIRRRIARGDDEPIADRGAS